MTPSVCSQVMIVSKDKQENSTRFDLVLAPQHNPTFSILSWSRAILVCWGLAILPALPLMFNKTIWRNWECKDNCKCFFPLDDVSALQGVPKKWLKEVLVTKINFLTSLQLHSYSWNCQKVWVFWACTTNFLIPTVLILLIWGLMVHHYIVNPASDQTSRWQKKIADLLIF